MISRTSIPPSVRHESFITVKVNDWPVRRPDRISMTASRAACVSGHRFHEKAALIFMEKERLIGRTPENQILVMILKREGVRPRKRIRECARSDNLLEESEVLD